MEEYVITDDGIRVNFYDRIVVKHAAHGYVTGYLQSLRKDSGGYVDQIKISEKQTAPSDYYIFDVCDIQSINFAETPSGDIMVDKPPHYQTESGLQAIDVIKAFTADLKGIEAVDTGNVLKYICRWKKKNGLQDLKKAKWYLEDLIKNIENMEDTNQWYLDDLIKNVENMEDTNQ